MVGSWISKWHAEVGSAAWKIRVFFALTITDTALNGNQQGLNFFYPYCIGVGGEMAIHRLLSL